MTLLSKSSQKVETFYIIIRTLLNIHLRTSRECSSICPAFKTRVLRGWSEVLPRSFAQLGPFMRNWHDDIARQCHPWVSKCGESVFLWDGLCLSSAGRRHEGHRISRRSRLFDIRSYRRHSEVVPVDIFIFWAALGCTIPDDSCYLMCEFDFFVHLNSGSPEHSTHDEPWGILKRAYYRDSLTGRR